MPQRWPGRCIYRRTVRSTRPAPYFAKTHCAPSESAGKRTSLLHSPIWRRRSDVAFRDLEQVAAADSGTRANLALITAHLQRREFDPGAQGRRRSRGRNSRTTR